MRFFASWWERFPVRNAAPAALVMLMVGLGISGQLGAFINQVQAQSGKALMPLDAATLIGSLKGKLTIKGDILSTGVRWNAESRYPHPPRRARR